jgi:ABC-type microcin C transport system duplicated ATPase subunit YejF
MQKGRLIESGATEQLWNAPTTEYARALLSVAHATAAPRQESGRLSQ